MRSRLVLAALAVLAVAGDARAQDSSRTRAGRLARAIGQAAEAREERKNTERYDPIFRKYTKRYFGVGFDWQLFKAQSMAESELNPRARSRVGARGLMQLMPSTFNLIRTRRPEFQSIDDPESNIAVGIMHDRYLWTLWKDHTEEERRRFMFASYNAGEGTIARARAAARQARLEDARWTSIERVAPSVERWRYRETLDYVRKIEANHRRMDSRP
jgi:soluble lytic murein transglycosylase-like protein